MIFPFNPYNQLSNYNLHLQISRKRMTNDSKPLIIAHRGESFDAPENTLAAINLAWERGAEAVEIDIQFSKDRELVVIHDTDTKRLAGIDKKVVDQTLEELKKLDVGVWKDIQFKGERVPTIRKYWIRLKMVKD
jgi:glycerophosphoryl diester phosphodiesterase